MKLPMASVLKHPHTARIGFAKTPRPAVTLIYAEQVIRHTQARFAGRYLFKPQNVDLDDYRRKAVIDWLDIRFRLARPSQGPHVKHSIDRMLGTNVYVEQLHQDEVERQSRTGVAWRVRLQEPSLAKCTQMAVVLNDIYGLEIGAEIAAMEVSVDFTPKQPSADARTRMFGVLQRHQLFDADVRADLQGRPRFAWGRGVGSTKHVFPRSPVREAGSLARSNDVDLQPFGDATYYVGRKDGPVLWKLMDKEIDKQDLTAGTWINLEEHEKRTRIEVTLEEAELRKLGLHTLESLRTFRFETLQSRYFNFRLPTFRRGTHGYLALATEWVERERRTKFLSSGLVGLMAMDASFDTLRSTNRKPLLKHLRQMGKEPKPETRRGGGHFGYSIAYEEMNKAIETALRNLRERESV